MWGFFHTKTGFQAVNVDAKDERCSNGHFCSWWLGNYLRVPIISQLLPWKFLTFRTPLQKLRGFPRTHNHQPSHPIPHSTAWPHSRRLGCAPNKWMKSAQSWAHSPGLGFFFTLEICWKKSHKLRYFCVCPDTSFFLQFFKFV